MMQLVASATMEEAIDKLMPFIMPIWYTIQIAFFLGVASFILWFINEMIKSNAQKREKEHQYKYISSLNTSTKSRLESVLLRKKDKVSRDEE